MKFKILYFITEIYVCVRVPDFLKDEASQPHLVTFFSFSMEHKPMDTNFDPFKELFQQMVQDIQEIKKDVIFAKSALSSPS